MQRSIEISIQKMARAGVDQLLYALNFCDPAISGAAAGDGVLTVRVREGTDEAARADVQRKVERLVTRYSQAEVAFVDSELARTTRKSGVLRDRHDDLVAQGVLVETGPGMAVLRGWLTRLVEAVDETSVRLIAEPAGAALESYPVAIGAAALAKTQHLSSFPEHLHYLTHLRGDLDAIDAVSESARKRGEWDEQLADEVLHASARPLLIMNPSVCYHCYASRAGTAIEGSLEVVTARSRCHRWEGGAMRGLRRLCDFGMREVIFLGHPDAVKEARERAEAQMMEWAEAWELEAAMVNANDPFFTDDYEVKAAFQRRQDLKHELAVPMPDGKPMAIASSNFHSVTFGKAFGITRGGRPICTGCVGFGLERWAYAVALQHGTDPTRWPAAIQKAMDG